MDVEEIGMAKRRHAPEPPPVGGGGMLPRDEDEGPAEFATDMGARYAEKRLGQLPDEPPEEHEPRGWHG